MNFLKTKDCGLATRRGFTLIELIVSISIIGIILSILVINFNKSGSAIVLGSTAYQVALGVRQAQVLGISGKTHQGTSGRAYGVYANATEYPNSVLIFVDTSVVGTNKEKYDTGDVVLETISLERGFRVEGVLDSALCTAVANQTVGLSAVFKRPDPDAIITVALSTGKNVGMIKLGDGRGATKCVSVTRAGQISVQ